MSVLSCTLTGSTSDYFTFTSFGDKLLFSNGVDGIFEIDFGAGTVTLLDGAPACKHLTTFDGRVIATDVIQDGVRYPARHVWSAKNNSHIWPNSVLATTAQMAFVSTSAADTMLATIVGTNSAGSTVTEIKALTGTTEMVGDISFVSITSIILASACAGIVSIKQGSNGDVLATLLAGETTAAAITIVQDPTLLLGSGYEDLLSTPGGQIDQARSVWPITDTIALCVRSRSIWQIMTTDNYDKPFVFGRLYTSIGSDAPMSIDALTSETGVTTAIIGLFNDNFYVMSHQMLQPIGDMTLQDGRRVGAKDVILAETTNLAAAVGKYDPVTQNYWFTNQSYVYRYSIQDQGWTRHLYPYNIRSMMQTKSSKSSLAISQLPGTIASLTGSIAGLVGSTSLSGMYHVSSGTGLNYVIHEDASRTNDANGAGGTVNSAISVTTGTVTFGSSLQRNQIIQTQLECTVAETQTLVLEFSRDNGATWEAYSTVTVTAATNTIIPFRHTVDSRLLMLRLSSVTLGKLAIVGLWAFGTPGAMAAL
jgi:hypothetical protein